MWVAPASGSVTIGHAIPQGPAIDSIGCSIPCTLAQRDISAARVAPDGLTSPASGVVVRFRLLVNAATTDTAAPVALRIVGAPLGFGALERIATGTSEVVTIEDVSGVQGFPTRLPIQVGDQVGVDLLTGNLNVGITRSVAGSSIPVWGTPTLQDGAPPRTPSGSYANEELLLQADIEGDADGDGYGDETQDGCPSQAATAGACLPPETFIDSKKRFGKKKNKVRVSFHASDPAARFTCRLNDERSRPCSTPVVYRGLPIGRSKVYVTASGATTDPTPAVAKVRVRRKVLD